MSANAHLVLGLALVAAGAVLALAFGDAELGWFQGRPLGVVLVVVGLLDLFDGWRKRRGETPD